MSCLAISCGHLQTHSLLSRFSTYAERGDLKRWCTPSKNAHNRIRFCWCICNFEGACQSVNCAVFYSLQSVLLADSRYALEKTTAVSAVSGCGLGCGHVCVSQDGTSVPISLFYEPRLLAKDDSNPLLAKVYGEWSREFYFTMKRSRFFMISLYRFTRTICINEIWCQNDVTDSKRMGHSILSY